MQGVIVKLLLQLRCLGWRCGSLKAMSCEAVDGWSRSQGVCSWLLPDICTGQMQEIAGSQTQLQLASGKHMQ